MDFVCQTGLQNDAWGQLLHFQRCHGSFGNSGTGCPEKTSQSVNNLPCVRSLQSRGDLFQGFWHQRGSIWDSERDHSLLLLAPFVFDLPWHCIAVALQGVCPVLRIILWKRKYFTPIKKDSHFSTQNSRKSSMHWCLRAKSHFICKHIYWNCEISSKRRLSHCLTLPLRAVFPL